MLSGNVSGFARTPDVVGYSTIQQLHELPDLAAEVFLTWGHPNPTERPTFAAKRVFPPAPADLDALDCLRVDELGLLHRLARCVRAVVEDMPSHPGDLVETPTWVSESLWLIRHHADWRGDEFLADWVISDVADIHRRLSQAARAQPPLRLACIRAGCGALVHLAPGGQFYRCENAHVIDHWAEIKRLGVLNQPVTVAEAAGETGVAERTLRRWLATKVLPVAGRRGNAKLVLVDDVRRVVGRVGV